MPSSQTPPDVGSRPNSIASIVDHGSQAISAIWADASRVLCLAGPLAYTTYLISRNNGPWP